jgi:hypothetical protein
MVTTAEVFLPYARHARWPHLGSTCSIGPRLPSRRRTTIKAMRAFAVINENGDIRRNLANGLLAVFAEKRDAVEYKMNGRVVEIEIVRK